MKQILALALLCASMVACSDDGKTTNGGGGGHKPIGEGSDSSVSATEDSGAEDDDDGGKAPPKPVGMCASVDPNAAANEDIDEVDRPSRVTVPTDFTVTRSVTSWEGDCDDPKLVITLSDGVCPSGKGHEIRFTLSANAIRDGLVILGENMVLPKRESINGIEVSYLRPAGLSPAGEWRSCKGTTGVITFTSDLEIVSGTRALGQFMLTLTDCAADGGMPAQEISGVFNVRSLVQSARKYCPTWE